MHNKDIVYVELVLCYLAEAYAFVVWRDLIARAKRALIKKGRLRQTNAFASGPASGKLSSKLSTSKLFSYPLVHYQPSLFTHARPVN